jgi:hypothetical protein
MYCRIISISLIAVLGTLPDGPNRDISLYPVSVCIIRGVATCTHPVMIFSFNGYFLTLLTSYPRYWKVLPKVMSTLSKGYFEKENWNSHTVFTETKTKRNTTYHTPTPLPFLWLGLASHQGGQSLWDTHSVPIYVCCDKHSSAPPTLNHHHHLISSFSSPSAITDTISSSP